MATSAWAEDRNVSIGSVLGRAFGVMGGNPVTVFGIAFLFGALPQTLLTLFFQRLSLDAVQDGLTYAPVAVSVATVLVSIALAMIVQGALVRATIAHAAGERAGIGESLAAGLPVALWLFVLSLLVALGVGVGLVLLIVPGIILYIMWCVATPALVEEREGIFAAMSRSSYLTKGARWKIFALLLLGLVLTWIVSGVFGVIMMMSLGANAMIAASEGLPMGWMALSALLSTINTTFWATLLTSLYVELRAWKDGPQAESLAEVFA